MILRTSSKNIHQTYFNQSEGFESLSHPIRNKITNKASKSQTREMKQKKTKNEMKSHLSKHAA